MILVDMNQVMISNLMAQIGSHHNVEVQEDLVRHMVLNSLRGYRNKFAGDYGELVICCDDKNYWRKRIFPYYKANRKKYRSQSELDWSSIFNCLNAIRDELKEHFPYKVMQIDTCEADDIIATICHQEGSHLLNGSEMILILSGDKDFIQLHEYENVVQYDPVRKRWIKHDDPGKYLMEHITKGDRGDGVPNILSDDNVFVEGFRQKPMSQKKVDNIIEDLDEGELLYAASWYRNYCRNKKLIDLSETPSEIKKQIINSYDEQDPWSKKGKVFPYLVSKRCNNLIESVQQFI